jgi:hypothetical protein
MTITGKIVWTKSNYHHRRIFSKEITWDMAKNDFGGK